MICSLFITFVREWQKETYDSQSLYDLCERVAKYAGETPLQKWDTLLLLLIHI